MTTTKQTFQIGKTKKLIDLNGDSINFDLTFKVTSKDSKPFEILVVDQTTLDNSNDLEYKEVKTGEITGSVLNDKNVYQNFFIILKSSENVICDVEITKKDLAKKNKQITSQNSIKDNSFLKTQQKPDNKLIKILLLTTILAVLLIGFYFFKKNRQKKEMNEVSIFKSVSSRQYYRSSSNPNKQNILNELKKL